jgi:fucose permease
VREPRHTLYAVACAAMVVYGAVLSLPGTVLALPEVADRLGLTLTGQGTLIAALFLGLLVGSLVSGPIVDAAGHRATIAGSAAAIAVALPLFAAAPSYPLAALALAAIGVASAGVNIASNALASNFFPAERGRRMNGLAVAFGAGGLALPAVTAVVATRAPWWTVVLGAAIIAAAIAVVTARIEAPRPVRQPADAAGFGHLLRQRGLLWVALLVALGAGTEASLAGFTSTYLTRVGFTAPVATWLLASHWVGLIAGRLAFAHRVDRAKRSAILGASLAGAASVLVLVRASDPALLAVMPFVIGVAIAIVVPTSLAIGGERYPNSPGRVFGVLLSAAQLGGMALPSLIGRVAEIGGVRTAVAIIALNNVVLAGICLKAARPMHIPAPGEPR